MYLQTTPNPDVPLESLSASISDVLAPVKLSESQTLLFEDVLFPGRRANAQGLKAEDYSLFVGSLVDLSIELNNLIRVLAYIVAKGGYFEDMEQIDFEQTIKARVETMQTALVGKEKSELLKSFLDSLSTGQYHVIKDSDRFSGGKDIIFSGVPLKSQDSSQTSSGISIKLANYETTISSSPGYSYDNLRAEHYVSEPALKAREALEEIFELIFKTKISLDTANKWERVQVSADFPFDSLNQVFTRKFGFSLNLFKGIKFNKTIARNCSLLLMLPPAKAIVDVYTRYLNRVQANPDSTVPEDKPVHSDVITPEANLLSRHIGVSLALNLPKDYVDYISQNTEGELNYFCLSSWITQWSRVYLRAKGSRTVGGTKGLYKRLPRYIIPASKNNILLKYRSDNKMPVDPGRVNEDRISVSPRGTLTFMPRSNDANFNNAGEYQEVLEKALEASYSANAPLTDNQTLVSRVFATDLDDSDIELSVAAQKKQLDKFKGTLLAMNWDYNISLSAGTGSPFVQIANDLNGSTTPSPLSLADYLGFDFSDEGERKQSKNFVQSLNYMMPGRDFSDVEPEQTGGDISDKFTPSALLITFMHNAFFHKLLKTYTFLVRKEKAKGLQDLIFEAVRELGYTSLNESPLDMGMYLNLDESGRLTKPVANLEHQVIHSLLLTALLDARGRPGSNLYKIVSEEVGYENASIEVTEHQSYFNQNASSMADFGNVYTYLGGLVFKKVCEEITKADPETLLKPLDSFDPDLGGYSIPFNDVSQVVMPLAYMFSKYVPGALDIFEKAEQEAEGYEIDQGIDVDDIQMPGIAPGSQVFPHQIKAHKYLRSRPKHAVLDIHPGGGKTITLILDIGNIIRELAGTRILPLVIAPDKLVANWCEDTAKITKGSWNCVPITAESVNSWGEDKLRELVASAPPNTIFFTGINFLKRDLQEISFGPKKLKLYGGTEFIKSLGFNYIALDESHKAKQFNPSTGKTSTIHTTVKQVFTGPGVLYTRLATGTLIHGLLQDVVGQAALFSAHIFRTPKDFGIDADAPDGAIRVRSKFGQHASVITIKRKEWAFMLPSPIDTFIEIKMQDSIDKDNDVLMQVYTALLQQTVEDLETAIKSNASKGNGDDNDDSDSDSDAFEGAGDDLDLDEDESGESEIDPNIFKYYMQRLEQMLVDPWGDPAFEEAAKHEGVSEMFVSPKVQAVVERLDRHFSVSNYDPSNTSNRVIRWEPGMNVRELAIVEYKGIHYMRRRLDDGEITPFRRQTPVSDIPPIEDPDNWKEELQGKVLIFCRYTRSTDAIFNSLPAKYKSVARRFHGQVDNNWQQIEDFKTDPDVKILVANEQAIVEGHNLQMASRIIRVETPWSPGDYEQSTARIFRPDPAAAKVENGKPGDMKREVIYIDWLMSAGTLEVAKVARLMWKTVEKTKFDEKGNPEYDPIMEISLDKISMNVKTLVSASTDGFESFREHFDAKSQLNGIEVAEFHSMRKTTLASMQDLPIVPPLETFKSMDQVPLLENQRIPDPDGFGLKRFADWYGEWIDKNVGQDKAKLDLITADDVKALLKGLPVRTEFGTGVVVQAQIKMITKPDGTKVIDHKIPVTSVKVRYNANDSIGTVKPRKLFVAAKVSSATFDEFFSTNKPWATESERKRIEKSSLRKERAVLKEEKENVKRNGKISAKVSANSSVGSKAKKRRDNESRGKPINDGVVTRKKQSQPVEDKTTNTINNEGDVVKNMRVKVIPSVYNGFLALHVNATDPDAKDLKAMGFKPFGAYAYSEFKTYNHFEKALDYVEDKFNLDRPTTKRLGLANDAFEDFNRMGFNMKQASNIQSDLPNFFRTRHREVQDKKTVKIYPVVLPDRIRLTVDLATNPLMRRHLNKTMPGSGQGGKWKEHEGMNIFFAVNKANAKAKLRELIKAGYEVTNLDKAIKQIGDLRLVRSAAHNKEIKKQAK